MFLARKLSTSWKVRHLLPLLGSISKINARDTCYTPPCAYFGQKPNFLVWEKHFCTFRNFCNDGDSDEVSSTSRLVCHGCGVYMQDSDPKQPGFFTKPSQKRPDYNVRLNRIPVADESEMPNFIKRAVIQESEESMDDGFSCDDVPKKPVVCARCHSLRHYGKVKDASVENLLPDFDFDHTIGRKLVSANVPRTIILMIVDAADFDGSFPRKVARLVSANIEKNTAAWKEGKPGNVPRVILVVTKIDILPSSICPKHFEHWVRQRAHEDGSNKITSIHLVSAVKDWGLKNLLDDMRDLAGMRGNVWALGAQNAGKSTLINALARSAGVKSAGITEAPVPGTTLGILRVDGILSGQAKLFDTPGLLHPYQISLRLTKEEQSLVHINKELKPRTYRIKAGYAVHVGGLARLDIEEASVASIYLTVWASPHLPLHMGKIENAATMLDTHFGHQLQPPIGAKRVSELGEWVKREFQVSGNSWTSSSMDVAVAGLGWFAIGLKGEASLGVWTYDGVGLTLRNSLLSRRASTFEETGFTVSKIVSKADKSASIIQKSKKVENNNDQNPTSTNIDSPMIIASNPEEELLTSSNMDSPLIMASNPEEELLISTNMDSPVITASNAE